MSTTFTCWKCRGGYEWNGGKHICPTCGDQAHLAPKEMMLTNCMVIHCDGPDFPTEAFRAGAVIAPRGGAIFRVKTKRRWWEFWKA